MSQYSINKLPSDVLLMVVKNFKALRKSKKLSQQKVADRSGVPLITIKRFEANGKIAFEALLKLGYALNTLPDFEQLFQQEQPPANLDDLFSDKTKTS